ncbi:unnamed protein product [Adineta steineri]|uniref:Uncharacterized protein n=1 Tax=Adineta steineri TaxID=433720 RepID=A0A814TEP6_9BILA|nr:unnamed protein product [Adineta steineri]CAF1160741.1 unnamed protein product [Adineta steineri]
MQAPLTIAYRIPDTRPMWNDDSESIWSRLGRFMSAILKWHVKGYHENRTLIVFRVISIILFLALSIIDTVAYAVPSNPPPVAFQFVWGAKYPLYDIASIIYCSGASVFGVSFEIYLFLSLAVTNVILQSKNCGDIQLTVIFLVRVICLGVAVELGYWNFRRLSNDYEPRAKSSRVMLRQSLLFSLSIIFFAAKGLRTVYDGALNKCEFQHFTCGLIDLDSPAFDPHSPCDPSYVEYVSSGEELRILRDWLMLNIAFYAIFNRALLDFGALTRARRWWFLTRLIILSLFLALTTSFLVVNISPFQQNKTSIVFDVIECALFVCCLLLMIYKLIRTRSGITLVEPKEPFETDPNILPRH